MLCGPENWRSWGELVPSVRTGDAGWDRAHGMTWIEFYDRHPEESATFNRAMAEHTRDASPGLVAGSDLARFGTVMDVGGGDGTLIAEALRAYPDLEGIVFDLPSGVTSAPATLEAAGVADRGRVVTGDFFAAVPTGADAYLAKQVLHDWDDERATAILRNLRAAVAPGGRVLILERMLPEVVTPRDAPTLLVDVLMMVVTGGRERTEQDFQRLFDAAAFELASIGEPLPPFDYRVIEATPA
ncbi:MAG: methyltransferase [Acidimicrobiales bacterium]